MLVRGGLGIGGYGVGFLASGGGVFFVVVVVFLFFEFWVVETVGCLGLWCIDMLID